MTPYEGRLYASPLVLMGIRAHFSSRQSPTHLVGLFPHPHSIICRSNRARHVRLTVTPTARIASYWLKRGAHDTYKLGRLPD